MWRVTAPIKRSDSVGCSKKGLSQGCGELPNLIFLIKSLVRDQTLALGPRSILFGLQSSVSQIQVGFQWQMFLSTVTVLGRAVPAQRVSKCIVFILF